MENGGTVGLGDAMILSQGANGGWGGANCFVWIILLFALMGGGFGGWNNRGDVASTRGFGYRVPEVQRVFAEGTQRKDKPRVALSSSPVYI